MNFKILILLLFFPFLAISNELDISKMANEEIMYNIHNLQPDVWARLKKKSSVFWRKFKKNKTTQILK